jgi:hypothetical protein
MEHKRLRKGTRAPRSSAAGSNGSSQRLTFDTAERPDWSRSGFIREHRRSGRAGVRSAGRQPGSLVVPSGADEQPAQRLDIVHVAGLETGSEGSLGSDDVTALEGK